MACEGLYESEPTSAQTPGSVGWFAACVGLVGTRAEIDRRGDPDRRAAARDIEVRPRRIIQASTSERDIADERGTRHNWGPSCRSG